MSSPYVGEIRLVSWPFAPIGWAFCDGRLLPIDEYEALFQLIGITYGGNGTQTFALPDLRGRSPLHFNNSYPLGVELGSENVQLMSTQIPSHNHLVQTSTAPAATADPTGAVLAATVSATYAAPGFLAPMSSYASFTPSSGEPHNNMQPYLCVNFIISLYGIIPTA